MYVIIQYTGKVQHFFWRVGKVQQFKLKRNQKKKYICGIFMII